MACLKRLTSCCCCYSLKVGTIITAALAILLSIITIVVVLTTRIDFKTVVRYHDHHAQQQLEFLQLFPTGNFYSYSTTFSRRKSSRSSSSLIYAWRSFCRPLSSLAHGWWAYQLAIAARDVDPLSAAINSRLVFNSHSEINISSCPGWFSALCSALDCWSTWFTQLSWTSSTIKSPLVFCGWLSAWSPLVSWQIACAKKLSHMIGAETRMIYGYA